MTAAAQPIEAADAEVRASSIPMIAIALAPLVMSFNVSSLPVAMSGMVESVNVPPAALLVGLLGAAVFTPEQVVEAIRVNVEARLRALRVGLLIMAGLALVTIIPSRRLPGARPLAEPPRRVPHDH